MSDPYLAAEIEKLRELAAAATPGPWVQSGAMGIHTERGDCVALTHFGRARKADSLFIAAARTAIPSLLARVADLERELDAASRRAGAAE